MLSKTQVKYIQSLFHKKFRDELGHFVVEGPKMVEEAIRERPQDLLHVYAREGWVTGTDLHGIRIEEIGDHEMKKISSLVTPAPALAVLRKPAWTMPERFSGLTLVLDAIQDPGNLGTIIRTADWFGVRNLLCGEGTVDCFNPKVVQASMGSLFRTEVFYTDIRDTLLHHPGVPVLASSLEGSPLEKGERWEDAFLVIGNESTGIRPEIRDMATRRLLIPRSGGAESLNAAVAAGILLYALTT
jgi:TrmH family RNA methyltransferase